MHSHFSAVSAFGVFLAVIIWGTLWRLIAAHLVAMDNPALNHVGRAMSFQY
jgi:hypothetical protein